MIWRDSMKFAKTDSIIKNAFGMKIAEYCEGKNLKENDKKIDETKS